MKFISPWIHTTEKCNLKCHYCYVQGKETMPQDVYAALHKLLLEMPTENRHLRFAGGEPLLVFNKWVNFAARMLEHSGTTVEVLTNLNVVPRDFWAFAEKENVNISVSIDNGKEVKVLDRKIAEKAKRLRNPWIMTTITKENVGNLEALAAFIGINNYGWCLTTDYFERALPHWEDLAVTILKVLKILKEFNYDFTKITFNNASVKSGFSGCKIGNEMFTVACNGDIYKCQTLINQGTKIGDVFNGYKRKSICERVLCKKCSAHGLCKGWCPIHYKLPNPVCNVIKLFLLEVVKEVKNAK